MASWGDIALARTWSARSRRRSPFQEAEHAGLGRAAGPGPLFSWPTFADAGLTAQGSAAERLVEPVGGESAAVHRPPSASLTPQSAAETPPLRVLIADDHPIYTELLLRLLARHEWIEVVGCAVNGRDAVMLANAASPDLILMDVEMPLMDGVEALRRIRERSSVTVLFLTASATPSDRERALAAGALAVLPKTTDPAELVGHLQSIFLSRVAA
jgi:CheY-like chemotaxis protein